MTFLCTCCWQSGNIRPPSNTRLLSFNQESFARAQSWISELQKQASPNIIIALAGNKTDLENLRAVQYDVRLCVLIASVAILAVYRC